MSFVHLHTHTAYSLLDGAGTIPKILDRAKVLGQNAMAITDHGNMYGVIEFYKYAKSIGIKPILGCEVYLAARSRFDKEHDKDAKRYHLILLAKNNTGYKNLMKIVSAGFIDGFYYKPRVDFELLEKYSDGIIALSGCMYGLISQKILGGDYDGARDAASRLGKIFGKDGFYIELQNHGLRDQLYLNRALTRLAQDLSLPLAATNDIHYVNKSDAELQDILMCIQTMSTLDDPNRFKMETRELYVKSEDEMCELFSNVPEAIENTQKIADMCDVTVSFERQPLPSFDVPEGYTSKKYLRELCDKGFAERYSKDDEAARARLEYELSVIEDMGFVDYFLIVWDFIKYAKTHGITVGPGRGSAAGSVVSYCLDITTVDPIKFGLFFERFLNPERISMPDIDTDFSPEGRPRVIEYIINKYGADNAAQIITFGTLAAKQAIRDVGRVLGVPLRLVDKITSQIPHAPKITIDEVLKESAGFKRMYDEDETVRRVVDTARELEGLPRNVSTHAAGVVITRAPLVEHIPIQRSDNTVTTQFPMTTVEELGLLKMDILGLNNLSIIENSIENIQKSKGIRPDLNRLDYNDAETYKMISRGDTDGIFQLESAGMKRFLTELRPSCLEDIIAGIALYRPGPMDSIPRYIENKRHPEKITYKHPSLEPILSVTYGCIVYQEQVMQIVRTLGGFSLGRADLVRKAMSKKKADVMREERQNFIYGLKDKNGNEIISGAIKNGIDEKCAAEIFDEMMSFASYAFNKAHAAAYSVIAYQTAWLKRHYPSEFLAALLSASLGRADKIEKYTSYAAKIGIKVLPCDINESGTAFTALPNGNIRYGLGAVKNVGIGFVEDMEAERNRGGRFMSFTDFCCRTADKKLTKKVAEGLIECGAFDSMGIPRNTLLANCERVVSGAVAQSKSTAAGQLSMFDMSDEKRSYPKDDFALSEPSSGKLYLRFNSTDSNTYTAVKRLISNTNGNVPVFINYADTKKTHRAPEHMWVFEGSEVISRLTRLLGEPNVKFVSH